MYIGGTIFDRAVLIDTGPLVALANPADPFARDARECADAIADAHLPVYVALPAIIEAHRLTLFSRGRAAARLLLDGIYDGSVNVAIVDRADEDAARALLSRLHWLDLSLADAINMVVMKRIGIRVAFTFDDDYRQAGYTAIPPFHRWWESAQ